MAYLNKNFLSQTEHKNLASNWFLYFNVSSTTHYLSGTLEQGTLNLPTESRSKK